MTMRWLWRRWLGVWLLLVLAGLSTSARAQTPTQLRPQAEAQASGPAFLVPVHSAVLVADQEDPPPDSAAWQTVSLPDNWVHRGFQAPGLPVWYRLEFELPEGFEREGAWGLYLPYLYDGGQFFLNGQWVGRIAETDALVHVKWERPHLLALPDGSARGKGLRAGRNVLHLRVKAVQALVSLKIPLIQLGPAHALQAVYEQRLFLIRTMAQFTSGACFVTALAVLFIWWNRRAEVLYGIFGVMALLWGVRTLTFVIEVLPTAQWALWRICYQSATGGFVVMMALFTLRTAGLHRPGVERFLIAYALLGPVILVLGGAGAEAWVSTAWTAGFFLTAVLIIVMVCLAAWRQRTGTAAALMFSVLVAVLAAGHDYFLLVSAPWFARLAPQWVAARIFVLAFTANVVLLVMGGILASRFIDTLRALEALTHTLDRRVAEREAVIAQSYRRLVELEGQRREAEVRQRIMQDMHDGLGAQLFSSLSRAERADLSQQDMSDALRGCIAEMRLAIDTLSSSEDDFEVAFSDFRYRWEPQLSALAVRSHWRLDRAPDAPALAPHKGLQVLRIMQEALTNVLKHSRAGQVQVRLTWTAALLQVEVEDDGVGLQGTPRANSRGLHNMHTRANRLGGTLQLGSEPGKTLLRLRLPTPALA